MRSPRRACQPFELLFGAYRRRVLSLLLLHRDRSFYLREISRLTRVPPGSLHRELKALTEAGILVRSPLGNQVRYQADGACPILDDLTAILRKSSGLAETVREAAPTAALDYRGATRQPRRDEGGAALDMVVARLAEVAALCRRFHVRRLDLFGSAARGTFDPARSDLDFVVSFEDLPPADFADAFFGLQEALVALFGRPVDLLTSESIRNPYLRESIDRNRMVLYAA
ncbi:MAG: nucleotidyltransferase domain-containing protein [Gemmatimonadales bacterium]